MAESGLTLDSIDSLIKSRRKSLAFPPALERQYEKDSGQRRAQRLSNNIIPMCVIYNLLLIGDYLLAYDRFLLASALHFFVVTPYMIAIYLFMKTEPARLPREVAAASLPVAIILQVFLISFVSKDPLISHYVYLILPPLLNASIIQRLYFSHAVSISALALVMQCATVIFSGSIAWPVAIMSSVTMLATGYTALIANYFLERETRRSYLRGLRDRIRIEEADAESRRDALTGLANRHFLRSRVSQIWGEAGAANFPVAVILLDIDHFKAFNDRYGHPAGDDCLKQVAARLRAEVRESADLVFRFGGEEFLVLLPKTTMTDAHVVAERLRGSIEALAIANEGASSREGRVTVSLGVAIARDPGCSADEVVADADAALYEAKRRGRNQVRMAEAHLARISATSLRGAEASQGPPIPSH